MPSNASQIALLEAESALADPNGAHPERRGQAPAEPSSGTPAPDTAVLEASALDGADTAERGAPVSGEGGQAGEFFASGASVATPEPSPVLMSTEGLAPLGPVTLVPGERAAPDLLVDEDSDPEVTLTIAVEDGAARLKFSAPKPSHVILHLSLPGVSAASPALAALIEAQADRRIVLTPAFTTMLRRKRHRVQMRSAVIDAKPWTLTEAAALVDFDQPGGRVALTLDLVVEDVTLIVRRLRVW